MPTLIDKLNEWIATLPEYARRDASLAYKYERSGVPRYLVTAGEQRAIFKLYRDGADKARTVYNRSAALFAEAEATALREFAPGGIAPELVWEGEMTPEIGGYGVIYRWVDGVPADVGEFTAEDARQLADVLWTVHQSSPDIKLIAPHPRDLAAWWIRVHGQYRDLSPNFISSLPTTVEEALAKLTQSVAGDANAHKRFWGTSKMVPVHGTVEMHNVIKQPGKITLVDWSRYGLGDRSYEIANAVWDMATAGYEEHVEEFVQPYTGRVDDVMLERQVQIYRRLLPYSRWLALLVRREKQEALTQDDLKHGTYYLSSAMLVYGWHEVEIRDIVRDFIKWLSEQER